MYKIDDIISKSFGNIKVLEEAEPFICKSGNKRRRVLGQCSCGKLKIFSITDLIRGHSKSCGCLARKLLSDRRKKDIELGGLVKARYKVYQSYIRTAKKRNYEFSLSYSQFEDLTSKNCAYCGIEPSCVFYNRNKTESCLYNGIDRINNKIGYTIFNCITCCNNCNWSKKQRTFVEFKDWIKRVYLHLHSEAAVESFEGTLKK